MPLQDIRTVVMGIGWIIFFFAPLVMCIGVGDSGTNDRGMLFFLAVLIQLALIVSIGNSWR